jgi:hypothetical protein
VQNESNPEKAKKMLDNYISMPQQWNRYVYVVNNPLKYVDPNGESIVLTGTTEERKAALERIYNMFGAERFKHVEVSVTTDPKLGEVTIIGFATTAAEKAFMAVGGKDADEVEFSQVFGEIIGSKDIVEYRIAESFQAYQYQKATGIYLGVGTETTAAYGGGATLNKNESLTGNVQIFVHPRGHNMAWEKLFNHKDKSSDGNSLEFTPEQVDAHEFGHSYNAIKWKQRTEYPYPALRLENIMRKRQGSPQRRLAH